jgi:prephenate dehydrogenase
MKVGILGYGQFGAFMTKHFVEHAEVCVYSRKEVTLPDGAHRASLTDACAADVVIFAVPMNAFELLCTETAHLIPETSVVVDVTSVKVPPLNLLQKYFPKHQILGTHPIFGPQSGKDGIAGLPIVLANVSVRHEIYTQIHTFLKETLQLKVIEVTAEEHDKAMAYVQGLTHFIGRALAEMHIVDSSLATQSYKQLIELVRLVGSDSWELFTTIENENPDAAQVRASFLSTLQGLEKRLSA